MNNPRTSVNGWVLLTGATGFVGAALLAELLGQGRRVLCLVRAERPAEARARLMRSLAPWREDVEGLFERGRLAAVRGSLHAPLAGIDPTAIERLRGSVAAVVHAAGSTRFTGDRAGEPWRTNVEGSRHVACLAEACRCGDWHFVSTAYVCGRCASAVERPCRDPVDFRNDYERSKWQAETELSAAALQAGASLTVYRPSIVAGDSESGWAARFVGVYYLIRATSLLARSVDQRKDIERHAIPLRIHADAEGHTNLICIDDVARMFGALFADPRARNGIYHLTHPAPPTNDAIRLALERYYDIRGGRFVGKGAPRTRGNMSDYEALFADLTDTVADYLFDAPRFDRTQVDRLVTCPPAPWSAERLMRMMEYAEKSNWRTGRESAADNAIEGLEQYFRRFLPMRVARSKIARLAHLDLDVLFAVGGPDSNWWCRFRRGRVTQVIPTCARAADVIYRTTPGGFWRAVSGETSGADLFLSGEARIEGDIERGLKFAMILQEFVQEHPCTREEALREPA